MYTKMETFMAPTFFAPFVSGSGSLMDWKIEQKWEALFWIPDSINRAYVFMLTFGFHKKGLAVDDPTGNEGLSQLNNRHTNCTSV